MSNIENLKGIKYIDKNGENILECNFPLAISGMVSLRDQVWATPLKEINIPLSYFNRTPIPSSDFLWAYIIFGQSPYICFLSINSVTSDYATCVVLYGIPQQT